MVMRTEARVSVSSGQSVVGNKASSHRLTQDQRSHIESASQLLAGGIAGAFSKTCTAPLSRLTILFQVQGMHTNAAALKKPSILHEASRILNEEGLKAFWKGNLVTIAHRLPYSSVNFYTYEHYKKAPFVIHIPKTNPLNFAYIHIHLHNFSMDKKKIVAAPSSSSSSSSSFDHIFGPRVYSSPSSSTTGLFSSIFPRPSEYKKDGDEGDSKSASRGNWWEGD
ncbi:hypothetical protein F2Q70_00040940 [Brassica cretica]|uniref:ADP,ATP carrier protein n=1 Tax=Brassica cretica TaxID=69181 RepID=A0A8S9K5T5_BRACR|nr:hypothetical protein F2Q70_00040940 [Brassica cretica]